MHIIKVGLPPSRKFECFTQLLQDFVTGLNIGGRNPANQLRLVVYPIIYRFFYVPGDAGFLTSAVFVVICNISMSRIMRNFPIKD